MICGHLLGRGHGCFGCHCDVGQERGGVPQSGVAGFVGWADRSVVQTCQGCSFLDVERAVGHRAWAGRGGGGLLLYERGR